MADLQALEKLALSFEKLPGVGKKTATRYAYTIIDKFSPEDVQEFAKNLLDTKNSICKCSKCGMLTLKNPCEFCSSEREKSQVLVVKDTKDVLAIEKSNQYHGVYHVLGGLISPIHGVGPDELTIDLLINRIDEVKELIVATPFTQDGETTYLYIKNLLKNKNVLISRIGFGLPAGGDIDYVDDITLKYALDNRTK